MKNIKFIYLFNELISIDTLQVLVFSKDHLQQKDKSGLNELQLTITQIIHTRQISMNLIISEWYVLKCIIDKNNNFMILKHFFQYDNVCQFIFRFLIILKVSACLCLANSGFLIAGYSVRLSLFRFIKVWCKLIN